MAGFDPGGPAPTAGARSRIGARLVRWWVGLAHHPLGPAVLVVLALLEATVFPAPTEALLIALVLARPRYALPFAAVATLGSVVGGAIGYTAGASLFESFARPTLERYGLASQLDTVGRIYERNMWLALSTSGYTPIPYMLYTMAAGAFEVPFWPFIGGSLIGRAFKYAPLAWLAFLLGPTVQRVIQRYAGWAAAVVVAILLLVIALRR